MDAPRGRRKWCTETSGDLNAIEILPVSLLSQNRQTVVRLRRLADDLRIGLGWHYLLDLTWIISHLGAVSGTALDAGAGWGLMQWYLCEEGFQVISADRASRADLSVRFRSRYRVRGLRDTDLLPTSAAILHQLKQGADLPRAAARQVRDLVDAMARRKRKTIGEVIVYNEDLRALRALPDESVNTVVAVSALEHNPPDELAAVVQELRRVLRPGGKLLCTLGAASSSDWFHEPSQGWCYTEASLRRIFEIDAGVQSNFAEYDQRMGELRACSELRDNLASFYFKSGENGMPWGVWDPQYQSAGVMVTK